MAKVTAARFQKEFGHFRSLAHREAVTVTSHGRDDVVLLSAAEYERLRHLERRTMHVSELSDEELSDLAGVEIPAECGATISVRVRDNQGERWCRGATIMPSLIVVGKRDEGRREGGSR